MRKLIVGRILNLSPAIAALLVATSSVPVYAVGDDFAHGDKGDGRGKLWMEIKDVGMTLEEANAEIENEPQFATSWEDRARVYFAKGMYAEALKDINHAKSLDKENPSIYTLSKYTRLNLGDSIGFVEDALTQAMLWDDPHIAFNIRHFDKSQHDEVLAAIETRRGEWSHTDSMKGILLYEWNRKEEALACFEKQLREAPDYCAYSGKATILEEMGKRSEAITLLKEGLNKIPGHLYLQEHLDQLLSKN